MSPTTSPQHVLENSGSVSRQRSQLAAGLSGLSGRTAGRTRKLSVAIGGVRRHRVVVMLAGCEGAHRGSVDASGTRTVYEPGTAVGNIARELRHNGAERGRVVFPSGSSDGRSERLTREEEWQFTTLRLHRDEAD